MKEPDYSICRMSEYSGSVARTVKDLSKEELLNYLAQYENSKETNPLIIDMDKVVIKQLQDEINLRELSNE